MKALGRAVADDVWAASVNRSSHEIYAKDRQEQKERSKSWRPDSLQVNAERIKRGELVGEEYLWGRRAVQMIKMGMLLEETLEPHRQSFLEDYKALYSKEFFDIKLKELNTKHSLAKEQYALT
jgi:hypothetical protein